MRVPPLQGLITEECLRIQSKYPVDVFGVSPHGEVREIHEVQVVLSSQFRWRE